MDRRDFLKKSALGISAVAAAGISGVNLTNLYAKTKTNYQSFSLEIITDQPALAIKLSQEFFGKNNFDNTVIKFTEYPVEGEMFGDIVFINNGNLVNYKNGSGSVVKNICHIAESLSLPKKISDSTRLRFHLSENDLPAEKFLIFHKNTLIKEIKADGKNINLDLNGSKGNMLLNIENNKARVIRSSCTHKTCVNSGSIAHSGESIVCIPNELVIFCE